MEGLRCLVVVNNFWPCIKHSQSGPCNSHIGAFSSMGSTMTVLLCCDATLEFVASIYHFRAPRLSGIGRHRVLQRWNPASFGKLGLFPSLSSCLSGDPPLARLAAGLNCRLSMPLIRKLWLVTPSWARIDSLATTYMSQPWLDRFLKLESHILLASQGR